MNVELLDSPPQPNINRYLINTFLLTDTLAVMCHFEGGKEKVGEAQISWCCFL